MDEIKVKNEYGIIGDCAYLILRGHKGEYRGYTVIDLDDLELVGTHKWCKTGDSKYAVTHVPKPGGGQKMLRLHCLLLNPPAELSPDHINRDGFDNRRPNLRLASTKEQAENRNNRAEQKNNTSGVKGVSLDKQRGKWLARIRIGSKHKHLGRFDDINAAAAAYQNALAQVPAANVPAPPPPYTCPFEVARELLADLRAVGANIVKIDGHYKISGKSKADAQLLEQLSLVSPFVKMVVDDEGPF